jgi:hypothetical protein
MPLIDGIEKFTIILDCGSALVSNLNADPDPKPVFSVNADPDPEFL